MIKWLASVQSIEEAKSLSHVLPDILDMKNPHEGALGALPLPTVREIVLWAKGRCTTSATIGDLPMQVSALVPAMEAMAETDVDYIKVGLFVDTALSDCIAELGPYISALDMPVIAVLFADQPIDLALLPNIQQAGFAGIMVDTAKKNGQGLREHWSEDQISQFVTWVKQSGLLCGLAGSLALEDIPQLEALGADYLGFRSALCESSQRRQHISAQRAEEVQLACYKLGLAS
jgi:uncharacterized protein (UPF0264 family)